MTDLTDLRYFKLFRKRYKTTRIENRKERADYWHKVAHDYYCFRKRVDCCGWHWYVITYKDGRRELAYFNVWRLVNPQGNLCRGIIPRYWTTHEHEHVKNIRLAF